MNRHRLRLTSVTVFLCAICSVQVLAQAVRTTQPLGVPSPRSVLGFNPGDDRTIADWTQITDYFARLDKASDRVMVQTIGQSTLKRPLIVALISARENLLALNKYKDVQQLLADPRKLT